MHTIQRHTRALRDAIVPSLVLAGVYFSLPLVARLTELVAPQGGAELDSLGLQLTYLFVVCPLAALVIGGVAGRERGWVWPLVLASVLLWIPAALSSLNESALPYGFAYGLLALMGVVLGSWWRHLAPVPAPPPPPAPRVAVIGLRSR